VTRVWLPYADWAADPGLPSGLEVDVWDGSGEPPASRDEVAFFVLPYLAGSSPARLLGELPALQVVQTLTAGIDDVRPLVPEGVTLCNARGVHDASTAELAVALTLASLRGIPEHVRAGERGEWAHDTRPSLADRRVLIVGYGSVGEAVERRLAGFECEVRRVARQSRPGGPRPVEALEELPGLLPWAEILILTVPMTDETRGLVDAEFLARLPDGALVVNVARGAVVVTDDLLAEVRSGRLRAALDVTDPEPLPPDHPLWSTPGVLISPHVGGNTTAFLPRARRLVQEQLGRYAAGEPLVNVIDSAY
jgi:phosphoglycerate dehydrogenase-like enzyme